ncbi:MAG TPA: tRNA lysidine(34) synthetase TilS [Candidatus Latescibacteria bacterium]|jgi:tRNA(Ile)-lysidine synthase|nr:tRNA lysidine(34) synthetase TilS [Gemmatimonadaceae bacterium]MDP6016233.1 tRNA lysidine(34) synthetase TilS [Candidatus Latescibacterota bacterium]HJP33135.1 tRNA lysidine(34) synthetase TilS [Candidatus Latescibacterota bacterium]
MSTSHPTADGLPDHVEERLGAAQVRPGDGIVVAVSGGVDSVVLLDILSRLAEAMELSLHVVHLDHGLRQDSPEDAAFVKALAGALGLPVTVEVVNVAEVGRSQGLSVEMAGRRCRRDLWERVRARVRARCVAVGHHADDQAETVLLRLLRGAGATGLGAMRPVADGGIVRPLLAVRRSVIEAYARKRGLVVREDSTNRDLGFPRNRVRHELIPHLEARHNPNLVEGLNRTASLLQADDDFLEDFSRDVAGKLLKERRRACLTLDTPLLCGYHIAVQRRVLRQYIQELAPQDAPSFAAVEGIVGRLATGRVGMHQVTGDIRAENTGTVLILRSGQVRQVQSRVTAPGQTPVPERATTLHATFVPPQAFKDLRSGLSAWRAAFDAKAVNGRLRLRTPRPGDRLQPLGMGGRHKKLSDCFIDAKWPQILRADALLLTRDTDGGEEEVLWVAGLTRSEAFRVTCDTDRILYLEFVDVDSSESDGSNVHPMDR